MGIREDRSIIEAAFYASDRPLTLWELRGILRTSSETYARKLTEELIAEYRNRSGPLSLAEISKDTFSLRIQDDYMLKLKGIIPKVKLSKGMIKTLALVAYKQPVQRARLADLRGSHVYEHIKQLEALGFIESKPFGRTRVLRTSKKFSGYFGFEDDMERIRERLEELVR